VLLRFSKSRKRTVSDGFVKKFVDSDSVSDSRRRLYNLYTPAIKHSAYPLVGGKCCDDAHLRRSFLGGTDATQPQANAPCARQQCRGHNHLGRSPLRPGHIGQPPATGRRRALQHCTVRSAPRRYTQQRPPSIDTRRQAQTHATQCTQ